VFILAFLTLVCLVGIGIISSLFVLMKDSESTGLFNTGYAFKVCTIINTLNLFSPYTTHACTVCATYNTCVYSVCYIQHMYVTHTCTVCATYNTCVYSVCYIQLMHELCVLRATAHCTTLICT